MTKAELLNNAKRIQAAAQELLDKTSVLKTDSKRQNAMKANLSARSAPQRRNAEKKKRLNV